MIPLRLSNYRLSVIWAGEFWGIDKGFFFFTLYAQLHAVLLNGLCLYHISFFFFVAQTFRVLGWMETAALCVQSRLHDAVIKTPQLTFNTQFKRNKNKIKMNKQYKTAQRWANLIITIIIPTIPQEWKYNTSKHISSTGTAKDMWLYWKL